MGKMIRVAAVSELSPGQGKTVDADGTEIALFNVEGSFHAINNSCRHRGGPLGEGSLEGGQVTCPWHGWKYDVVTGKLVTHPDVSVPAYPVQVQGDEVFVELP
jgi:nitrite reductase (NADH) small subunit